jgi:60 kDa SS-A/Ro ribonucleoprotein
LFPESNFRTANILSIRSAILFAKENEMATINKAVRNHARTAEGGIAKVGSDGQQLARVLNACLLWEDTFYVDGKTVAELIADQVAKVKPEVAQTLAVKARSEQKLRHAPLLVAREMARAGKGHRLLVAETLERIIQRPDELTEFLAIYWKDGKEQPLSAQVKKGLQRAFRKFDEFSLAKYNRDGAVKLRDVLFLIHPKAKNKGQQEVWNKLVEKTLETPDTWEVALSGGADKAETFTRLIEDGKLGALALLRNLRNMTQVGVSDSLIRDAIVSMNTERVLPFRFISAAKYAPQFESELETAMFKCLTKHEKLDGKTVLLVDVSGSMDAAISGKSDLERVDAACGLAMLLREVCEEVRVFTFSEAEKEVPARRGFALAQAIKHSQPHSGTYLGRSSEHVARLVPDADRVIVISDEQAADPVGNPFSKTGTKAYMVNVATDRHGVGYGSGWSHVDGWSEAIVDYILAEEQEDDED